MHYFSGIKEDISYLMDHIKDLGSPWGYNHYPVGWAWGREICTVLVIASVESRLFFFLPASFF